MRYPFPGNATSHVLPELIALCVRTRIWGSFPFIQQAKQPAAGIFPLPICSWDVPSPVKASRDVTAPAFRAHVGAGAGERFGVHLAQLEHGADRCAEPTPAVRGGPLPPRTPSARRGDSDRCGKQSRVSQLPGSRPNRCTPRAGRRLEMPAEEGSATGEPGRC